MILLKNEHVVNSVPRCLLNVYNEVLRNLKCVGTTTTVQYPSVEGYEFLIRNDVLKVSYVRGSDRFAVISTIGKPFVSDDVLICS